MSRSAEKTGMTTAANEPMRRDAAPSPIAFRTEEARGGRRHMASPLPTRNTSRSLPKSKLANAPWHANTSAPKMRPAARCPQRRPSSRPPHADIQPGTHQAACSIRRAISPPKAPARPSSSLCYEKQHRHAKAVLLAVLLIAAILGLVWYFFPR